MPCGKGTIGGVVKRMVVIATRVCQVGTVKKYGSTNRYDIYQGGNSC